ncbi:dynein heavy chain [Marasmius sp. AFHP31]|nr:dynein heavy chain [Marasmius sp. AFHP31]
MNYSISKRWFEFAGLCQVGAWGFLDEFNRLEERIPGAVSQPVQTIQQGLASLAKNPNTGIELVGKISRIIVNMGILITTKPNYAGQGEEERRQLPFGVTEVIVPKLVADDVPLLTNLLADVFPEVDHIPVDLDPPSRELTEECKEQRLVSGERWILRMLQLY